MYLRLSFDLNVLGQQEHIDANIRQVSKIGPRILVWFEDNDTVEYYLGDVSDIRLSVHVTPVDEMIGESSND